MKKKILETWGENNEKVYSLQENIDNRPIFTRNTECGSYIAIGLFTRGGDIIIAEDDGSEEIGKEISWDSLDQETQTTIFEYLESTGMFVKDSPKSIQEIESELLGILKDPYMGEEGVICFRNSVVSLPTSEFDYRCIVGIYTEEGELMIMLDTDFSGCGEFKEEIKNIHNASAVLEEVKALETLGAISNYREFQEKKSEEIWKKKDLELPGLREKWGTVNPDTNRIEELEKEMISVIGEENIDQWLKLSPYVRNWEDSTISDVIIFKDRDDNIEVFGSFVEDGGGGSLSLSVKVYETILNNLKKNYGSKV